MKTNLAPEFSAKRFLLDALAYNGLLGSLLVGSLAYNAEIWVNDYPPDIREKFGTPSKRAKRQSIILAIPFFLILLAGVIWSNLRLRKINNGRLPFNLAFINTYALFFSFWLFDLTILDWLFFTTIQPAFIILPGTEGMAGYADYGFHLRVSLPALPLMILPSAIIAGLMTRSMRKNFVPLCHSKHDRNTELNGDTWRRIGKSKLYKNISSASQANLRNRKTSQPL